MKRVLFLAAFLRLMGLYAQNTPDAQRPPWAQVIVTPGPQGLPTVNSYVSPWPLGTALEDTFSGNFQSPVPAGNPGSSQTAAPSPEGNQSPPAVQQTSQVQSVTRQPAQQPVQSGRPVQSQQAAQTQPTPQTQPTTQTQPTAQTPQTASQTPPSSQQSAKQVVVPSPVHYDRAGRRVIDPGWQDTLAQIVRSERAAADDAANNGAGADSGGGDQPAAQEPVRETIIVVPGPTTWRIRGTLTVAKGMLALDGNDGVLWYLPGLDRYIGFIDGLDAGEEAILEGYAPALGSSQERYFQPTRLFLDDMDYDLSISPYGFVVQPYLTNPGGQTVIRETERPPVTETGTTRTAQNGQQEPRTEAGQNTRQNVQQNDRRDSRTEAAQRPPANSGARGTDTPWSRRTPPTPQPPAWQHDHTSPWAPPTSVFDFEMDYDSFWQDDPVKQERRERDSREIWY